MLRSVFNNSQKVVISLCLFIVLVACETTPFDYASQDNKLLCYMAIQEEDEQAKNTVSERIAGGVESQECKALAARYRQELLKIREEKRNQMKELAPGSSSKDPFDTDTADMPEINI